MIGRVIVSGLSLLVYLYFSMIEIYVIYNYFPCTNDINTINCIITIQTYILIISLLCYNVIGIYISFILLFVNVYGNNTSIIHFIFYKKKITYLILNLWCIFSYYIFPNELLINNYSSYYSVLHLEVNTIYMVLLVVFIIFSIAYFIDPHFFDGYNLEKYNINIIKRLTNYFNISDDLTLQ